MKKIYFILIIFATFFNVAKAQQPPVDEKKQQDNIEALKVAFISKELDLTPEEAQKFWPIYNQYSKELAVASQDNPDVLDRDEKVLNVRKRYKEQFVKVLGQPRINKMYGAEGRFHKLLIKAMRKQQNMHQNKPNRPYLKRSF
ncbi:hypothetical protein LK994_03150 [Ferruginibacter lapsinanis]|uniref:hypothetical protein n=1 Tax=Ferruginibacter lapsinanis TaxID=563172 RepID=UPI001E3A44F8|nr:hypothetical protein [Ferruginibacter lapsinanis]UEG50472.1 hypothetical protein LK994_03150 [Ferruginibacter lapsinanis]